ncbi:zf-HC2 domain-containing protein [Lentzea sp. NBRC 102530]|uniref:zf-HC2 domain-containing protein n=1 Tax=Lentzea sp. NBRC 102530 TaxID=3032201 RepID=UPI0024A55DA5|nr:zf-HC2 domain-containing protein [Lentzea sp. NBRC 102530]GLY47375.1 membrane protein [Lentzea sp. NBRC 102530]
MTTNHPSEPLLRRYARGDADLPADQLWAVEAHLETCAPCRGRLAPEPIAEAVWAELLPQLDSTPQMPRSRRRYGWVSPAAGPWLAAILLVTAAAVVLDRIGFAVGDRVSVVLLVAPVLPVLGVAASWSRALDPAYELTAATPRAGLPLVFRRTAAVLGVLVPGLTIAGLVTDVGFARWLLPCLAFTLGTLALGTLVGVTRAAVALIAAWAVVIVAPTIAFTRTSTAFDAEAAPVWAGVLAVSVVVIVLRRMTFTRLEANR